MFWDGHGWGWGGWFLMTLSMVVFWGLVIAALAFLLRGPLRADRGSGPSGSAHPSAELVLAERYARGEIGDEEYRRRLDVIRRTPGPASHQKRG